jgi:predicted Zn finger-like uncharacterized protein
MRVITHCPACQTQFFATEEQLNQHGGKVRCGQCMHVFDARAQMLDVAEDSNQNISTADNANNLNTSSSAESQDTTANQPAKTKSKSTKAKKNIVEPPQQPAYLDDTSGKSKLKRQLPTNKFKPWLWVLAAIVALLLAITQSIYFLRNEIAIYYPQFKPVLSNACQMLNCKIQLPKQIEFIVIDDSDMQEDAERSGLIYFSTTLINTGSHAVTFPDLELTLTDIEENPVLRRIFKPAEYLTAQISLADGFKAGAEIKVKLAMTTSGAPVSGYRVFVTY